MMTEFLMYAYFGITKADPKDIILKKFAERAYIDLAMSTIGKFKSDDKNERRKYRKIVCEMLSKEYCNLLECKNKKEFDKMHKKICDKVCEIYIEIIPNFSYGQAQKWLNMMLKYMFLLEGDLLIKEYLHVPIDKYIMQAVGSNDPKLKHCLKLECVPKKDGTVGKYSESSSKPWSKWNYDEYIAFQNAVRTAVSESNYNSPIEWENEAWIEVAEFRK